MQEERIDILVVDDDETNLEMYSRILGKLRQADVHVARTGYEALDKAAGGNYGLVLLDIMMPGMDGYQVARAMRERLAERTPPIIFITAFGKDDRDKIKGFEEGAADFLFKPYDLKLLEMKAKVFVEMELGRRALQKALLQQQRRADEFSALLQGARDVLAYTEFPEAARRIFDRCRDITGATAGYVALLSNDGHENEVLFLESGGRDCSVDPDLPMPIRGLRGEAYRHRRTVVDNDFTKSRWMRFMPSGHVPLDNVMFAPLIIEDCVVGILGLANKPGGFNRDDERMASAFGELAAISLRNARTLEVLHRTTRLMRKGQQIAGLGSFEWNVEEEQFYCSEELAGVLGHDSGEPLGITGMSEHVHDDDRKTLDAALQALAREERGLDMELRVQRGSDVRIVHFQAEMDRSETGRKIAVGTCQDVTERREMEQRAVITQKLDALGQLAGGLAHEMNTPLQYIMSNIGYIESSWKTLRAFHEAFERLAGMAGWTGMEEEVAHLVEEAQGSRLKEIQTGVMEAVEDSKAGLDKVSSIIKSLVRFSRSLPEGEACCDLNRMVEDTAVLTENHWKGSAEIAMDLSPDLPAVLCTPGDISNCLLNLFINAAQAIRAKFGNAEVAGRISIRTRVDDGRVLLTVEDNGVGIPDEHRDKVFDPFFTTKEVGEGTGMGLTVARAAITACGGTLDFVSEHGKGTAFTLGFPVGRENCPGGD